VRLLLDTHAFLWFVAGDASLSATARTAIADPGNQTFVSIASAWEVAIKVSLGKLTVDAPTVREFFDEQMETNGFAYRRDREG
jgi:PIN domain nuclease of toxin-antitoxin system